MDNEIGGDTQFPDPLIGTMVGRFRVERKIGQGGMGAVYELLQPAIHKRMALKLLHEQYATRQDIVQRFFGEAKAVNLIGHPNIVDISDFSHLPDGRPFIIMEFLEGQSLEEYLEEHGALDPAEVLALLKQMCSGLGAAHAKGIVHRDIKPENFFITKRHDGSDFLKVLDFGIAKLKDESKGSDSLNKTEAGIVLGTPTYMSPEQAQGNTQDADHRTDVYSLGVVLYQMLTGKPPFVGKTFAELIIKHLQQAPPSLSETRSDLPAAWGELLAKALAKSPDDRYQSMAALYEAALEANQEGIAVAHAQATVPVLPPVTERKKPVWLLLPVLLLAGGVAFFATRGGDESKKAQGPQLVTTTPNETAPAGGTPVATVTIDAGLPDAAPPDAAPPDAAPAPDAKKKPTTTRVKKDKGKGTLKITTKTWAHVTLDGKALGPTPLKLEIPAGKHKVTLTNTATGARKTYRFILEKDGRKTIEGNL